MGIGMVSYRVSFLCHAFDEFRVFRDERTNDEKGSGDVVLFQGIKDGFCISVFITCIKGQVENLFLLASRIISVVFFQFRSGSIGYGRLTVFLKA